MFSGACASHIVVKKSGVGHKHQDNCVPCSAFFSVSSTQQLPLHRQALNPDLKEKHCLIHSVTFDSIN